MNCFLVDNITEKADMAVKKLLSLEYDEERDLIVINGIVEFHPHEIRELRYVKDVKKWTQSRRE